MNTENLISTWQNIYTVEPHYNGQALYETLFDLIHISKFIQRRKHTIHIQKEHENVTSRVNVDSCFATSNNNSY
jgi:hypothetical protein